MNDLGIVIPACGELQGWELRVGLEQEMDRRIEQMKQGYKA
jgi:hypothetical protein